MQVRLLGPLQVLVDGAPVALGGAAERALLARLALQAGRVVPAEHLIDSLWARTCPPTPRTRCRVGCPGCAARSGP